MDNMHQLNQLYQPRNDWKVRVRITRMWRSICQVGNFVGQNMIFLDSENNHVHAFAYPHVWNNLQNMLFEGNIYDIKNFNIVEPVGTLRPVSSMIKIILTVRTIVQPVPLEVNTIPRHKFEITEIGSVYDIASRYAFDETPINAIDVLGLIQNMEQPRVIHTHLGDKYFVRLELYDGRHKVKINVWDEKIEDLSPIFYGNFQYPPIVIFTVMKPLVIFGSLQISTSKHSMIYLNLDYGHVRRIEQRILDQDYQAPVLAP